MKPSLLIGTLLLLLLIAGCNNSPAAPVPRPAGPQGQFGQTGGMGQTGRTGDQGGQNQAASCPAGEHLPTDHDSGKAGCLKD